MKIRTNGLGEETKKTKGVFVFEFSLVWFGLVWFYRTREV